ncbi:MAG TPA: HEAT repeat domain-containing protein [Gemmataceae bacterium]|nr:HEAT repeat domain-containing protein [Gemmataceae bacterium]
MIRITQLASGFLACTVVIALAGCDVPSLATDETEQADPGIWYGSPVKQWILDEKEPELREQAKAYLDSIGSQQKELVPALVALLKDDDAYVRRGAARLLGQIGPNAKDALEPLEEALQDADKGVTKEVLRAYKRILALKP